MPLLWSEEFQRLLPGEAENLLSRQQSRFEKDWDMFRSGSSMSRQDYLYYWLLVNTRGFSYDTPTMQKFPEDDRYALLPMADFFNHSDAGCTYALSDGAEKYTFTANGPYRKGDEIPISYGNHSNDLLLVEYGFLLPGNRWDTLCLDGVILPKLEPTRKSKLVEWRHTGDFMLHSGSKRSDRIWIALRALYCEGPHWQAYVDGKDYDETTLAEAIKGLPTLLEEYLRNIEKAQSEVRQLRGESNQKSLLGQRWKQIEAITRQLMSSTWFVGGNV